MVRRASRATVPPPLPPYPMPVTPRRYRQYNTLIMITDKGGINHVYRKVRRGTAVVPPRPAGLLAPARLPAGAACPALAPPALTPPARPPLPAPTHSPKQIFPWVPKEPWTAGHETSVAVGPKGLIVVRPGVGLGARARRGSRPAQPALRRLARPPLLTPRPASTPPPCRAAASGARGLGMGGWAWGVGARALGRWGAKALGSLLCVPS